MNDEPIEVERDPDGSGMVVSVRFSPQEADAVLMHAGQDGLMVTDYIRLVVLREVWQPAIRTYH